MKSLLVLGRQPALGLAELESLYGSKYVESFGNQTALLDIDPEAVEFSRLGSSVKLARLIDTISDTSWPKISDYLDKSVANLIGEDSSSKLTIGVSAYGLKVRPVDINRTALSIKKSIKARGRSVRVVPNKSANLNSAQVIHNGLTSKNGLELLVVSHSGKTYIARTVSEQDIEAYTARDQKRPMRDARVGMLPPKLAQTIINLTDPAPGGSLLDPFCGTGVLLQEAMLMGHSVYGTDIDSRMIEYSRANLNWLIDSHHDIPDALKFTLNTGSATDTTWQPLADTVACETFLGKPLSVLPPHNILAEIMSECDQINRNFLKNLARQTPKDYKMCIAVPAWRTRNGFLHLKTLDNLAELGYTRKKFVHVRDSGLIYHRPDQVVARELVVLERI